MFSDSDIITFHVPLTADARGMVKKNELLSMKKDAFIINTARGGIIDEDDLYNVMQSGPIAGVAIDANEEPYTGPLINIDRCLLTSYWLSIKRM